MAKKTINFYPDDDDMFEFLLRIAAAWFRYRIDFHIDDYNSLTEFLKKSMKEAGISKRNQKAMLKYMDRILNLTSKRRV